MWLRRGARRTECVGGCAVRPWAGGVQPGVPDPALLRQRARPEQGAPVGAAHGGQAHRVGIYTGAVGATQRGSSPQALGYRSHSLIG